MNKNEKTLTPSSAKALAVKTTSPVAKKKVDKAAPAVAEATSERRANASNDGITLLVGDRFANESDIHVLACNNYLRLGRFRTLRRLAAYYTDTEIHQNTPKPVSLSSLKRWSRDFDWKSRGRIFDSAEDEERTAKRRAIMEEGFALDYARVERLKKTALKVQAISDDKGLIIKTSKYKDDNGQDVTIVEEKYNGSMMREVRRLLKDIAKEKGDRQTESNLRNVLRSLEARIDHSKLKPHHIEQLRWGEVSVIQVLLEEYLYPRE